MEIAIAAARNASTRAYPVTKRRPRKAVTCTAAVTLPVSIAPPSPEGRTYSVPSRIERALQRYAWHTVWKLPTATGDLEAGQALGPYHIEDVLGEGGMAKVFRARREGDGQIVALKVMKLELG